MYSPVSTTLNLSTSKSIVTILFVWIVTIAVAHPHVFMTTSSNLIFTKGHLQQIDIELNMDEMASLMLFQDYDKNENLVLDTNEVEFYQTYFEQFKDQNYLADLRFDGHRLEIDQIRDLHFHWDGLQFKITYSLIIDRVIDKATILEWTLYDNEYYNDLYFSSKSLKVEGLDFFSSSYDFVSEDESKAYYLQQIYPNILRMNLKPKSDV